MADYSQMLQLVADYYGTGSDQWLKVAGGKGATADELLTILKQTPGVNVITGQDGSYRGWTLVNTGSTNVGTSIGAAADSNIIGGTNSLANTSNTLMPPQMAADSSTGLITITNSPKTLSGKLLANGGVAPAIAAVATGLSLGVTIDKALYKAKPGFLSDEQLEALNPDNWKQISSVVDEQWTAMGYPTIGKIGRKVFDTILGVDSTDNSTQMYIDEDAYAYMAWYLQQQGVFAQNTYYTKDGVQDTLEYPDSYSKIFISNSKCTVSQYNSDTAYYRFILDEPTGDDAIFVVISTKQPNTVLNPKETASFGYRVFSKSAISINRTEDLVRTQSGEIITTTTTTKTLSYLTTLSNGDRIYSYGGGRTTQATNTPIPWLSFGSEPPVSVTINSGSYSMEDVAKIIYEGTYGTGGVSGTGSQSGATLPNLSTATDLESFKTLLKQQYPDVWTNSVTRQVLQPDGTLKTFTYVPVPTPNATGWMDTEPTGDGSQQSQKDTVVKPDMADSIKDTISSSGSTGTTNPNPPGTGDGDSPTVVPPVGKASSLWSIYNPTLEQVNQFGSWLWSSDFVEQLKKLFSDPMQAIIGLHKVYSPVQTSGQDTIKCGYLDSAVPSKLVSEQYTTVDCGSVDLQEYFGNVFDYPPYTEVSIYLPFIGIRQLDPSDVMRSTISVKYHIDVLTGACLAEVNVQRDAAGGTLYTFSGDAAVRYPVSSGSYMGIVSGLIGVATSIVSGNLLPALGGATRLHTNVERSGSFTGNSGAMGSKVPYLIISRPQTAMADKFETLSGYPSNTYTPLSACKGFTQVNYCHVENLSATETEKNEIERLLKEGVIL